jgi:hypothetical protein
LEEILCADQVKDKDTYIITNSGVQRLYIDNTHISIAATFDSSRLGDWGKYLQSLSAKELQNAKLICGTTKDTFYFSVDPNIIWLVKCINNSVDPWRFNGKKVQLSEIRNPWIKKYLSTSGKQSCLGMMPYSRLPDATEPFKTKCLDTFRCSAACRTIVENAINKTLKSTDWRIMQQSYNVGLSRHYFLAARRHNGNDEYCLVSTHTPISSTTMNLIDTMNRIYNSSEYQEHAASYSKKMQLYAGAWYIYPAITESLPMTYMLKDPRKNCEILYNLVPPILKKSSNAQPSKRTVFMQQYGNYKKWLANATLPYRQRLTYIRNRAVPLVSFVAGFSTTSAAIILLFAAMKRLDALQQYTEYVSTWK